MRNKIYRAVNADVASRKLALIHFISECREKINEYLLLILYTHDTREPRLAEIDQLRVALAEDLVEVSQNQDYIRNRDYIEITDSIADFYDNNPSQDDIDNKIWYIISSLIKNYSLLLRNKLHEHQILRWKHLQIIALNNYQKVVAVQLGLEDEPMNPQNEQDQPMNPQNEQDQPEAPSSIERPNDHARGSGRSRNLSLS